MRIRESLHRVLREVAAAAKSAPAIYFAPLVGAVKEVQSLAKEK
jgi:hypothetical protein